jgi:Zn finger protein HypA/HybF involved in hydrogenase expression
MAKKGTKAWKANIKKAVNKKVYKCVECGKLYKKKETRKGGTASHCHSK